MGEIVHTSRIRIVREKGPTRRAMIEGFNEPVYYGVHGGIKRFYKVEPEKEHAATLDHIVLNSTGFLYTRNIDTSSKYPLLRRNGC